MKIGSVETDNFTVLAPLAGITNLPMRLLAKRAGCGLVCSEMISSNGLVYSSGKTVQLLDSTPEEKPLAVQIFGSDPPIMADAARIVQDSGQRKATGCGCTVSVDVGSYGLHPCHHNCLFCYANPACDQRRHQ